MPRISVILPVYGVEEYLDRCMESLLNQDFSDFEVLLVDDGSPDGSGKKCDLWAEKDARVCALHKENGGVSDARNFGLDAASGDYVTFVDPDDSVERDYLSYLLNLLEKNPRCGFSACNHFVVRREAIPNANGEGNLILDRRSAFESVLYHGCIDVSVWGKLYPRSLIQSIRFPVGKIYEDTFAMGELLSRVDCIVFGYEPKYRYYRRGESISGGTFQTKQYDFLEAVDHLTELALRCDLSLERACLRRKCHAGMSVLRLMEHCPTEELPRRAELRRRVLDLSREVLLDPRLPKRDRLAIATLKMGFWCFSLSWKLYGALRRGA